MVGGTPRVTSLADPFHELHVVTRLPPEAKKKVAIGQLRPTQMYGSDLHRHPTEEVEDEVSDMPTRPGQGTT